MRIRYFPYDRFRIRTRYSVEQVQEILYYHIVPSGSAAKEYDGKEFYGEQYEDSFEVSPVIFGNVYYQTMIQGELVQEKEGVVIEMTAGLRYVVPLCMISCGVLAMSIWLALSRAWWQIGFVLPILGVWGMYSFSFRQELETAKKNLHKIFGFPVESED